ncbi:ATP-binding protein [Bradyrhizobium australafricanum]|uniref:ATP-binding protein n=1 Tax=Bradyrhizobium australafricanum TaxID=2821406 RepID=UPI0035DF54CC
MSGRTPSRASALASASSGSANPTGKSGSMLPPCGRSTSALHALGLHGMAKAFADIEAGGDAASLGHAEWLALLLEREASLRRDKRLSKRLQYAKLRQQACVEDIDYRTPRGLDRSLLTMLVEGQWIDDHANLLICGPSGLAA